MTVEALHHLILCYDVQESAGLDNPAKIALRRRLSEALEGSLDAASIPAGSVSVIDRGDGALVLVDARVPKIRVLTDWLGAFHARLQADYERSADRSQIRLAVHAGEVHPGPGPEDHTGADLDFTCRLVDAPVAKRTLSATPSAALAVIVSESVYHQVVRHAAPALAPSSFAEIQVRVKETSTSAWLHLPGWARVPLPPPSNDAAAPDPTSLIPDIPPGIAVKGSVGVIGNATVNGPFTVNGAPGGGE